MIAMAVMKTRNTGIRDEVLGVRIIRLAMRLMWIPGVRPVIVPARTPRRRGRIR